MGQEQSKVMERRKRDVSGKKTCHNKIESNDPPWPNVLSFNTGDWQDPLRSFNEAGMGGLQRDVYGGEQLATGGGGYRQGEDDDVWPEELEEDEENQNDLVGGSIAKSKAKSDGKSDDDANSVAPNDAGNTTFKRHVDNVRVPPMVALKRSTAKLSAYMSPDAIMQLQMQEQQRAHDVQRRTIEKTFAARHIGEEKLSQEKLRLKDAIQAGKEKSYASHEYQTHSAHLFTSYEKYLSSL